MECPSPVVYGMPHQMTEETLLEVDGVSKIYGKRKVVDGVSLRVNQGEVVVLLRGGGSIGPPRIDPIGEP